MSLPKDHFLNMPKATAMKEFNDNKFLNVSSRFIRPFIDSFPLLFDVNPALLGLLYPSYQ